MPGATVFSTIKDLVAANWSHCAIRHGDANPEDIAVPKDLAPFAELTFESVPIESHSGYAGSSNNLYREIGAAEFAVFIPFKESVSVWLARIDTLRDALRGYRPVADANFRIHEVPSASISNSTDFKGYRKLFTAIAYTNDLYR